MDEVICMLAFKKLRVILRDWVVWHIPTLLKTYRYALKTIQLQQTVEYCTATGSSRSNGRLRTATSSLSEISCEVELAMGIDS